MLRNDDGTIYYDEVKTLTPEEVFEQDIDVKGAKFTELTFEAHKTNINTPLPLGGVGGGLLWHAESDEVKRVPDAAEAALPPEDTKTVELLYLTGLHLEQYRHATWSALDYYEEGLRRDPKDTRINNQLGLWYLRRGRFDKAEPYLRTAVKVLQKRNPNPYWGEPLYNLGLCLKHQGKIDEAYDWFYKATWNGGWQSQAYFSCAQISTMQGRLDDALYETERALRAGWHHHKARALRAALLRKLGRTDEAKALTDESLKIDRFNYGCLYESGDIKTMKELMHQNPLNYHELALDYAQAGLWQECIDVLSVATKSQQSEHPLTYYYIGWAETMLGHEAEAKEAFTKAEHTDPYCCFPNRLEDILALRCADAQSSIFNVQCSKASYYLGCLYYDKRQYDVAIQAWEHSRQQNDTFPTVWRCLALAAYNKEHDSQKALRYMERAYSLDETDARVLMELDQLYKVLQHPHAERLALLQKHPNEVAQRDDLILEEITLLNQLGRYDEAMQKLDAHQFHPWEGGEGKVPLQYQTCRVEKAKGKLKNGKIEELKSAIALLTECLDYPHHLGEGKLQGAQENDFYNLMGCAYEQLGDMDKARECWLKATEGPMEPAAAMYYNDAKPDKIFYAGLAWQKLGEPGRANGVFYRLITYGEKHIFDEVRMDYFAVSLPDLLIWDGDLQLSNTIHCKYMMALGHYGLGHHEKSQCYLHEAASLNINHQGVQAFQTLTRQ